jgi:steroid 5-alpha reductase family enzyme
MITLILFVLAAMAVVMTLGWLTQRGLNNGGWTDVFWTYGTGAACAIAAALPTGENPGVPWRRILVAVLIAVWSLRLGTYVALRVARGREDVRYATLRKDWGRAFQPKMFVVLIVQAPITALLAIGVLFAARNPVPELRVWDALGVAILILSIAGEALADAQMKRFKSGNPKPDAVCRDGLWAWSRHPNYFFEALIWVAYPVMGLSSAHPWSALSLLAPLLMFAVIRYATGIPPLEAAMVKCKGEPYRRYQAEVSALFPLPPKV